MPVEPTTPDHLRFHAPHLHLTPAFGGDWFGVRAERFARFFGTPSFLFSQTLIVIAWVVLNSTGLTHFDLYPFIFLNLAFSLQAAYAAPLILLAQTRQADRDKANAEADARHREALAQSAQQQQAQVFEQNRKLLELMEQNTQLTQATRELSERIEALTDQIHQKVISPSAAPR
jgi:uncharacterized membrane protein